MEYKFRNSSLILMGDSHSASVTYQILASDNVKNGVDIVHLGDVGLGFGYNPEFALAQAKSILSKINELAQKKDLNVYLNFGNHDFPKVWQQNWSFSNVFLTGKGETGIFPNGKKALFVGGGISIDRARRVEGVDYWRDEITPKIKPSDDYFVVFSHDCPEHFNNSTAGLSTGFPWLVADDKNLIADCEKQRNNMTRICVESGSKIILHSHFHNTISKTIDGVYCKCININELFPFNSNDY